MGSILGDLRAGPPPVQRRDGLRDSMLSMVLDPAGNYATAPSLDHDPSEGLGVTTAWACINLIVEVASSLPNKIVKRGDRSREEQRQPEFAHVWGRPNKAMTSQAYWEAKLTGALVYGNAFSWKSRRTEPQPETWRGIDAIYPMHPARVKFGLTPQWDKVFVLDEDKENPRTTVEIGHVPVFSLDGVTGMSPIRRNARALALAQAQERFGSTFFSRGQQVSGILSSDQVIDQDQADEVLARWMERHAGGNNAQRPVVMGRGMDWKPIALPPNEAQFIEARGYQREDIIQIYRVPPHMIGLVEKSTSWGAGVEWQYIGFVVTNLLPLLLHFEEWVNGELLPPELNFKFNANALLRGDMAGRVEFYRALRQMGVLSADGILELEDLPPRGIEDDYVSPTNMERLVIPGTGSMKSRVIQPASPPQGRPVGTFGALGGALPLAEDARDGQDLADAIMQFLADRAPAPLAKAPEPEAEEIGLALSQRMAQSFIEGSSYGQVAIQYGVEGVDPVASVKQRLRRHFGGSPAEARRLYHEDIDPPIKSTRVSKTVERDAEGRIARVIEETIDG